MIQMQSGREGQILRGEDRVFRPSGPWSPAVHQLLKHLEQAGFDGAPKVFGVNQQGQEELSFVDGETYNYPLKGAIASREALESAARLLRSYHDATVSFLSQQASQQLQWMLPSRQPQQVICHGDFAPYNVALNGNQVVGVFDFDTAHPAPRIWDIAYAIYCWAPFKTNPDDALGDLTSQTERAKWFCDAYGLEEPSRATLIEMMIERIQTLVDFMRAQAAQGNSAFIANLKDDHDQAYLADIAYLKQHQSEITQKL